MTPADYKSMTCTPTPGGGRVIAGSNPMAAFHIEVAADPAIDPGVRRLAIIDRQTGAEVGTMTIEIRTPPGSVAAPDAGDCTGCRAKSQAAPAPGSAPEGAKPQDLTSWHAAMAEGTALP